MGVACGLGCWPIPADRMMMGFSGGGLMQSGSRFSSQTQLLANIPIYQKKCSGSAGGGGKGDFLFPSLLTVVIVRSIQQPNGGEE